MLFTLSLPHLSQLKHCGIVIRRVEDVHFNTSSHLQPGVWYASSGVAVFHSLRCPCQITRVDLRSDRLQPRGSAVEDEGDKGVELVLGDLSDGQYTRLSCWVDGRRRDSDGGACVNKHRGPLTSTVILSLTASTNLCTSVLSNSSPKAWEIGRSSSLMKSQSLSGLHR